MGRVGYLVPMELGDVAISTYSPCFCRLLFHSSKPNPAPDYRCKTLTDAYLSCILIHIEEVY